MDVKDFFDPRTWTLTYVAFDPESHIGVVVDPVLDYDLASGRTRTESADAVARLLDLERIRVPFVLETHAYADHISAMSYFKERFCAKTAIGAKIVAVQRVFRDIFNLGGDLPTCRAVAFESTLDVQRKSNVQLSEWHLLSQDSSERTRREVLIMPLLDDAPVERLRRQNGLGGIDAAGGADDG
jgi:glyoxylase-like metal-dependent hydrolase (beta-lactamase superfamily II)